MNDLVRNNKPVEMWGGVECSFVRLRNRLENQMARSGHDRRIEDLDRFAQLGIKALRYPVLWELHDETPVDWTWADERLGRLRALGIRPIVGFIHHGSGALPGGLLDPGFIEGLGAYARRFAERYPWVDAYTPVNEPLTTARFSGLYGVWHPFAHDEASCFRALYNECAGTRAAMKAIREINPAAELIQTEDMGKTHSTPRLAYQAEFENERRWLTFDLLCGRIDTRHPLWPLLRKHGLTPEELRSFVGEPCVPDVFGINYYVTSERFLDERLERYPVACHGSNHRERYADLTAVRVRAEGLIGVEGILRETWERYRRPIAMTEVQLACTRDEQIRWVVETWESAKRLAAQGVDVRAITPWSLLGAFDWDSLLARENGRYENGAFDVRSPEPRSTALADAIRALATCGTWEHPVLASEGWWRRPVRLEHPAVSAPTTGAGTALDERAAVRSSAKPVLIVGAGGRFGSALQRLCQLRGLPSVALRRDQLDITDADAVQRVLGELRPWMVVNAAGYTRIDHAETDHAQCHRVNGRGAAHLSAACAAQGAKLALFSSDLLFHGRESRTWLEHDTPEPLNVYGHSQWAAERETARLHPGALIVRTGPVFSAWDADNFATKVLTDLREDRIVTVPDDAIISPTYLPDLLNTTLDLLIDGETGIWHLANHGAVSYADFCRRLAILAGARFDSVEGVPTEAMGFLAARPRFRALGTIRGGLLSCWEDALERYFTAITKTQLHVEASAA